MERDEDEVGAALVARPESADDDGLFLSLTSFATWAKRLAVAGLLRRSPWLAAGRPRRRRRSRLAGT
jgi:hypothetical protein